MNSTPNLRTFLSSSDDAHLRKALNLVYIYAVITHIMFLFAFRKFEVKPMEYINYVSSFLYLLAFFLNKKKNVMIGAVVAVSEAIVHGAISTVFVGWNANFHMYIILVYLLIFFLFRMRFEIKALVAFGITGIYVFLYLFTVSSPPIYEVPESFILTSGIINIINTASVLSLFAFAYSYFIRKSIKLLEDSYKNQRLLNAQKNKFFSIFSHDLKNPISSLYGFLELLLKRYDTMNEEKRLSYLNQIYSSVGDTYTLVNDLLEWSKSQMDNIQVVPENIDPNKVLNDIKSLFEPHAATKNIQVVLDLNAKQEIFADNQMFHSIARNLVSNAIKFSEKDKKVHIETTDVDSAVMLSVSDEGVGISEKRQQELFKIDKKEIVTGTNNERGTGLGLIVVKEFIEKNNGQLQFKSQLNKGTTFTVLLPSAKS